MTNNLEIQKFIDIVQNTIKNNSFIKLTFSKKRLNSSDLENVYIKQVEIKNKNLLQFTYHHTFHDIVKNYELGQTIEEITILANSKFHIINLLSTEKDVEIKINKSFDAVILEKRPSLKLLPIKNHNVEKSRSLDLSKKYFNLLGITTQEGVLVKTMIDKYKQIEKYIEIFENLYKQANLKREKREIKIVDMGCGKGYLTFALYDHLVNNLELDVKIVGVETQQKLVDLCNDIAKQVGFKKLRFEKNNIDDFQMSKTDVLIALHACDTATDDAIYKGIKTNASLILVAPCCHKQIRKQISNKNILTSITKHGILLERQAEMLTDGIRALLLESYSYKSNVFEFISAEHTGKNLMISAFKTENVQTNNKNEQVEELKKMFGIEYHYLEKLLEGKDGNWKNLNPICNV